MTRPYLDGAINQATLNLHGRHEHIGSSEHQWQHTTNKCGIHSTLTRSLCTLQRQVLLIFEGQAVGSTAGDACAAPAAQVSPRSAG